MRPEKMSHLFYFGQFAAENIKWRISEVPIFGASDSVVCVYCLNLARLRRRQGVFVYICH
jgi:hypothetical protein